MTDKNVSFTNTGSGNIINQAAGDININNQAGGDINKIAHSTEIKNIINELGNLLSSSLKEKDDQIKNLTQQLIESVEKPEEKRDKLTIGTILGTVSTYIGMLGNATEQIQKIKPLFEQVKVFFGL